MDSISLEAFKPKDIFVPSGRIIGGSETIIEIFPYQVSIQIRDEHLCGASIISPNFILTAGHCIISDEPNLFTIRSGSTFHAHGGNVHHVKRIIRHEKYGMNFYGVPKNDIALMEVVEPFVYDQSQQSIQMLNATEKCRSGTKSVVSGWGKTEFTESPKILRSVEVPILNQELCNLAYRSVGGLPKGQICAAYYGTGGKDSCQGDSGGPLAVMGRLAGVVSWGNGCATADYPGVYTEVAFYRDWIKQHANL